MFRAHVGLWVLVVSMSVVMRVGHAATVVNFDDVPPGTYGYPQYESAGVYIETGDMPNSVSVGSAFTQTNRDVTFVISAGGGGLGYVSPPNFAAATGGGTKDVFFSFPVMVTSLSLRLDTAPETPGDLVRLLALKELGPGTFEVVALDQAQDNVPGAMLSVSLGGLPFQWAAFQTTTEAEGFDDLTFTVVPEPSTSAVILALAGLLAFRRRKRTECT